MTLPIGNLPNLPQLPSTPNATAPIGRALPAGGFAPSAGAGQFSSILESAIQGIEQKGSDANQAIQNFLSGDGEELHSVALATQRAELAFDLGLQVRNKIVSAYQEIMRMQM